MHSYCVYKHTSPSGKVYIGITSQTPSARWRGGEGYRHNEYFFRAILKYGWANFDHEILHVGLTKEEACAAEVALIAAYHSNEKKCGYNLTRGGDGRPGVDASADYRASQSEKTRALWSSPEYRAHMVAVHMGKKQSAEVIDHRRASLVGHPVTDETKRKISERLIGNTHRARAVLCVETGIVFATIKDAAVCVGVAPSVVNRVLHGHRKTAGGYHWRYFTED